jgi:hypothetical protein
MTGYALGPMVTARQRDGPRPLTLQSKRQNPIAQCTRKSKAPVHSVEIHSQVRGIESD